MKSMLPAAFVELLQERYGQRLKDYLLPPPVFVAMKGEFVRIDAETGSLCIRFPIMEEQLNPYGTMQGGMVAAAVDNTLGPLSMLVAPANVTRRFELKFSRPITLEIGYLWVTATLTKRDGRWLHFKAEVRDEQEQLLARATATHWIVAEENEV